MKTSEITTTTAILAEYKAAIRELLKADLIEGESLDAWLSLPKNWKRRNAEAYEAHRDAHDAAYLAWVKVERIRASAKKEGLILGEYKRPMFHILQDAREAIMDGSVEFDIYCREAEKEIGEAR